MSRSQHPRDGIGFSLSLRSVDFRVGPCPVLFKLMPASLVSALAVDRIHILSIIKL